MKRVSIFLSSPGDCSKERRVVHEIVDGMNSDPIIASFAHISVHAWDWGQGIPLDALASPQASVNKQLPLPEVCDIFVGIFRCRFGTPLPQYEFRKNCGTPFSSGSEYEFFRAWDARRRGANAPDILMYRQSETNARCANGEQLDKLTTFFSTPPFKDCAQWTGSVNRFNDTNDFKEKISSHLRTILSKWQPSAKQPFEAWLKHVADRVTNDAGPRYTAKAHVESDIATTFDWLLMRTSAIQSLDKALASVWKNINYSEKFSDYKAVLSKFAAQFRSDPYFHELPDFDLLRSTLDEIELLSWKTQDSEEGGSDYTLRELANSAADASNLLKDYAEYPKKRVMLVTGAAGQGKTHTLVHELNRVIDGGGMAIGILGHTMSATGDLWAALLSRIDFKGTSAELLDHLENEVANKNQRALIVIDAINETPDRKRWKNQLNSILQEILKRKHISVVISARSDYLSHVLPRIGDEQSKLWVEYSHPGFLGIEPDALLKYCQFYDVKAPVSPPVGELTNPLYVQLLVKSMKGIDQPMSWTVSWLSVWSSWIDRLDEDAQEKFELDPTRVNPVRRILNKVAKLMVERKQFQLSREEGDNISRKISGIDGLISYLCSAGALIDFLNDDEDFIQFSFERLTETFVVDHILRSLFDGLNSQKEKYDKLVAELSNGSMLSPIVGNEYVDSPLYYQRSGILAALCLATPTHIGSEIPPVIERLRSHDEMALLTDRELSAGFSDSLRWRTSWSQYGAKNLEELFELWQKYGGRIDDPNRLDELIQLSIIPGHPFTEAEILHRWLMDKESLGERDSVWSIHLVPLYGDESSNVVILLDWACSSNINGIHQDIALPLARVFAWICTTSQRGMREKANQALMRVLVACPDITESLLEDLLHVNDAYVLESLLISVLGLVLNGQSPRNCKIAVNMVYREMFSFDTAKWCHITIRHYTRRIVEEGSAKGWDVDIGIAKPPYKSSLPLSDVPSSTDELKELCAYDGFRTIVWSATEHDFFRYTMGGNSGSLKFSCQPLLNSPEPARPYKTTRRFIPAYSKESIFDLDLAARFVAWNTLKLGWTDDRFKDFDSGLSRTRIDSDARTERIGKKYQWISWYTILAYLADNYRMMPENSAEKNAIYDRPDQIRYINLQDPSRWLQTNAAHHNVNKESFWDIASLPGWPDPSVEGIRAWIDNPLYELPAIDVINSIPYLPTAWGKGHWIRIASEHSWHGRYAPGVWGLGKALDADIWWQTIPGLVKSDRLDELIALLDLPVVQRKLKGTGRLDPYNDWNAAISDWPGLSDDYDETVDPSEQYPCDAWLPIEAKEVIGLCGHPDRQDEHRPIYIPLPYLFGEWGLQIDLNKGIVHKDGEVVFGLAGSVMQEDALFANLDVLQKLLVNSGYSLIWWLKGERRAYLDLYDPADGDNAWVNMSGVAYLGRDGRVNMATLVRDRVC